MGPEFWHQRWKSNDIGFHQPDVNPLLEQYCSKLNLPTGARVFVPLCGKSNDLIWLVSRGYDVIGVELSELAVIEFFNGNNITPEISELGALKRYAANNVAIMVGDIFDVTASLLGTIHAIYDRAALVALPELTRIQYTQHLTSLTNTAKQLLITYEYDQSLMDGPPFSINDNEVHRHYDTSYAISLLADIEVENKLKGHVAHEKIWWLRSDR